MTKNENCSSMEALAGQLQEYTRWEFLEGKSHVKKTLIYIDMSFAFTMCQNVNGLIMHVEETVQASFDILQWSIT